MNVIKNILTEREKQDLKWGKQNHTPIEWLPILMEEIGEVSKEILECYYTEFEIFAEKKLKTSNYRKELVQVAAVVIAMIENYDRDMLNEKL